MTTNQRLQRRREQAAGRLRTALAPDSGHEFGTWKTLGFDRGAERVENPEAEEAARLRAEQCLRNLEAKNVRPAS